MVVPSPFTKSDLRVHALAERKAFTDALTPELRAELEADLARIVLPHLAGARIVAGYHPMKDEISPYPILETAEPGQHAVLPWFAERDSPMLFREAPALEEGPWRVMQPAAWAKALEPDTVLVPLVYVDRKGNRIGQGKGHYDRALAKLRQHRSIFTIGLAWDVQVSEEPIPADPWDMPLDAVATPSEWIRCR